MSRLLHYKDYYGSIEYSEEDGCLFGKVIGVRSLLSYEGESVKELIADFHSVIDEYLDDCQELGVAPEKPFKGNFNVRIDPKVHQNLAIYAKEHDRSLNSVVEEAIKKLVC